IMFNIGKGGPQTIHVASSLPTITAPMDIEAISQPEFVDVPLIELDGSGAGANVNGLTVTGGQTVIRGFTIDRFSGSGIALQGQGSNTMATNFIGTDPSGLGKAGNGGHGIAIFAGSNGNIIGGSTPDLSNVISGNAQSGVALFGAASANVLQGN